MERRAFLRAVAAVPLAPMIPVTPVSKSGAAIRALVFHADVFYMWTQAIEAQRLWNFTDSMRMEARALLSPEHGRVTLDKIRRYGPASRLPA